MSDHAPSHGHLASAALVVARARALKSIARKCAKFGYAAALAGVSIEEMLTHVDQAVENNLDRTLNPQTERGHPRG